MCNIHLAILGCFNLNKIYNINLTILWCCIHVNAQTYSFMRVCVYRPKKYPLVIIKLEVLLQPVIESCFIKKLN